MAEPVYLPKVGMTMEEGRLARWIVPDGASVQRGQPIFELETEKVEMEVEADAGGILKHLVAEDSVLKPGDLVGCLLASGEEVPQALLDRVVAQSGGAPAAGSASAAATLEATAAAPAAEATAQMLRISPVARRLADEHGVNVRGLSGSGPEGRIVERDVQRAIEALRSPAPPVTEPSERQLRITPVARRLADEHGIDVAQLAGSGPGGRIVEQDVLGVIEARKAAELAPPPRREDHAPEAPRAAEAPPSSATLPYTGRRRTIGERMLQSRGAMPQVTLSSETRVDDAMKMIHGLNREWRKDGVVITLTALVVRACALALREHPQLNAHHVGDHIALQQEVNVGVAVDQEQGLIVPVVHGADRLSLQQVAARLRELTALAKEDRLGVDDVSGGSFTVSSLDGTGVDAFTPIINPPQAAILGVGRVRDVAVFEGDAVVKSQVTTLSLTFDHRVSDGAPAARFLDRVAELLDRPYLLM